MIDAQYWLDAPDTRPEIFLNTLSTLNTVLADWRQQWPDCGILALLPEARQALLAPLQQACRQQAMPLLGACFPHLVTSAGFSDQGIWLLRFNTMPAHALVPALPADSVQAATQLVAALPALSALPDAGADGENACPTLFLLFDGMLPHIGSILNQLYFRFRRQLHFSGVNAGSERFQPMPCLFDGEHLYGDGVMALLLPAGTRTLVEHGFPVSRALMQATSTEGNRIDHINGKPAFSVYQEIMWSEYGVQLTHENFYDYAVHFPFGVVTMLDVLVRIPVGFNEDGSLFCVGEVPPNAMLHLLRAPALEDSQCVNRIVHRLQGSHPPARSPLFLTFYCAGRRMHFGTEASQELAALQRASGSTELAGALSLGEIDTLPGLDVPRFHNACIVCIGQAQAQITAPDTGI